MNSNIKELINRLDPNKVKCNACKE